MTCQVHTFSQDEGQKAHEEVARLADWLGLATGGLLALVVVLAITYRPGGASTAQASVEGQAAVQEAVAVSQALHYQGRLLTPGTREPKPDGSYSMMFQLYNVSTGGAPLWAESKGVAVSNGLFSTLLGDTTPLNPSVFNGQELYLGVTVGSDPETSRASASPMSPMPCTQRVPEMRYPQAVQAQPATLTISMARIRVPLPSILK